MYRNVRTATYFKKLNILALALLFAPVTYAQSTTNQQMVFEGTLSDSSGSYLNLSGQTLYFYISANGCYLYGESSTTAGDSQGNILHRFGSGSILIGSPNSYSQNLFYGTAPGVTTFAGGPCSVGVSDTRVAQVQYGSISASMSFGSVPYSHNTSYLNGKTAADFVLNSTDTNTLLYGGTTGQYLVKGISGLEWSSSSVTAAQITSALGYTPVSSTNSGISSLNGSSSSSQSFATGNAGTNFNINTVADTHTFNIPYAATSGVIGGLLSNSDYSIFANKLNATSAAVISALGYTPANTAALGSLAAKSSVDLSSSDVSGTLSASLLQDSGVTAGTYYKVSVDSKGRVTSGAQLSSSDVTNALGYTPVSGTGSGISSLNGATSSAQTFVTQISGSTFNVSTSGSIHTFSVPMAWTASATAGLLSNIDYNYFSGKLDATSSAVISALGYTPANNANLGSLAVKSSIDLSSADVSGTLSVARLPNFTGDVSSTAGNNSITVTKIRGQNISVSAPTTGQILSYDGSNWGPVTIPIGGGTVTNVSSTNPDIIVLSGTTTPTLTLNVGTGANQIPRLDVSGTLSTALLQDSGVTAGTYYKVSVDNKGRVTSGAQLSSSDVTNALGYAPISSTSGTLQTANNLSDLTSSATARANLGLTSLATKSSIDLSSTDVSGTLSAAHLPSFTGDVTSTVSGSNNLQVVALRGSPIATTAPISGSVLKYDGSAWVPANITTSQWTTSGSIVYYSGKVGIGTATPVTKFEVSGGVRIGMESAACGVSYAGTLRYNAGSVEFCNGTTWSVFGVSGAGISSLNGATSPAQTFVAQISGSTFNISTSGSIHTFSIPMAWTASSTAGLLSNADYNYFSGKLDSTSSAVISALGYTPANATGTLDVSRLPSFTGDVSSASGTNILTVGGIQGRNVAATTPANGQVLKYNGTAWAPGADNSSLWSTTGSDIYYNTGNVGIGTTTPDSQALLHVNSDTANAVIIASSNSSTNTNAGKFVAARKRGGSHPALYDYLGAFIGINPYNQDAFTGMTAVAAETHTNSTLGSELRFYTVGNGTINTSQRMTITNSGNVGIGTTAPNNTLEVVSSDTANMAGGIKFKDSSAGYVHLYDSETSGFAPTLAANIMGIYPFSITANTNNDNNGNPAVFMLHAKANNTSVMNRPLLAVKNNTQDTFVINANGNVGLNVVSPTSTISLNGTGGRSIAMERNISGAGGQSLEIRAGAAAQSSFNQPGGSLILSGGISTGNNGGSSIEFRTSASSTATSTADVPAITRMTITGSGKVGIGNVPQSTSSTLTVSGSIEVTAGVKFQDGTSQTTAAPTLYEDVQSMCTVGTAGVWFCTVDCTAGKRVVGGGCRTGSAGSHTLQESGPSYSSGLPISWTCQYTNIAANVQIYATAFCMKMP